MPTANSRLLVDELTRHESFVRSALRGLLADEGQIQDALQETWLKVLRRPASEFRSLEEPRTWLARVAQNLAMSSRRSEFRRSHREVNHGRQEGVGSSEESLIRMESRQRIVASILSLGEPYREVILMRYEQDLGIGEIGSRLGRSEATVRSQLSRAHELLRVKLDGEFGGRPDWAVLAFAIPKRVLSNMALGSGIAMLGLTTWIAWALIAEGDSLSAGDSIQLAVSMEPVAAVTEGKASHSDRAVASSVRRRKAIEPIVPEDEAEELEATHRSIRERLFPVAVLFQRGYGSRDESTFSLEYALRDDPRRKVVGNDWDFAFQSGKFDAETVTDDTGLMIDLGLRNPKALSGFSIKELERTESAAVKLGHTYFVWSRDSNTDLAGVLFVRKLERGRSCEIDWYVTDGTDRAQGSFSGLEGEETLVDTLVRMRSEVLSTRGLLKFPRVFLQARTGHGGGNLVRVHMDGSTRRLHEASDFPIDLWAPVDTHDRALWFYEGGSVPEGHSFRVTRATWSGRVPKEAHEHGEFRVVVGGRTLVRVENSDEQINGEWSGEIDICPGEEQDTYLGVAYFSCGEVVLEGAIVEASCGEGFGAENKGFFGSTTLVPMKVEKIGEPLLTPRVLLQLRSGAGGGNPNRIDILGLTSVYVDEVSESSLDFSTPPKSSDPSIAYFEGGHLRDGSAFVVTQVEWSGTSAGDNNGHGQLRVVVASEVLVDERTSSKAHYGLWTGRLRIGPGEESRTYVEIANTSSAEVTFTGYFEE